MKIFFKMLGTSEYAVVNFHHPESLLVPFYSFGSHFLKGLIFPPFFFLFLNEKDNLLPSFVFVMMNAIITAPFLPGNQPLAFTQVTWALCGVLYAYITSHNNPESLVLISQMRKQRVLIFDHCATNHRKFSSSKPQLFIRSRSCRSGVWARCAGFSAQGLTRLECRFQREQSLT